MPVLHCLRQSASRVSRLLLPLLLLSWLSVFCGNCAAMADMAAGMDHPMPMAHAGHDKQAEHDCCDHQVPCTGADCDHLQDRPALKAESKSEPLSPVVLMALLSPQSIIWPTGVADAVPVRDTERITPLVTPLYLQNCVFLI